MNAPKTDSSRSGSDDEVSFDLRRSLHGWGLPFAGVLLVYAGHYLYGGLVASTSLALTAVAAVVLAGCLAHPRLRQDLGNIQGLTAPAILFAVVLLLGLISLTPWVLPWNRTGYQWRQRQVAGAAMRWAMVEDPAALTPRMLLASLR